MLLTQVDRSDVSTYFNMTGLFGPQEDADLVLCSDFFGSEESVLKNPRLEDISEAKEEFNEKEEVRELFCDRATKRTKHKRESLEVFDVFTFCFDTFLQLDMAGIRGLVAKRSSSPGNGCGLSLAFGVNGTYIFPAQGRAEGSNEGSKADGWRAFTSVFGKTRCQKNPKHISNKGVLKKQWWLRQIQKCQDLSCMAREWVRW